MPIQRGQTIEPFAHPTWLEHGAEALYEPLDLKIASCRLMTAARKDAPPITGRVRVATKFVKIAQRYFASQGIQAEIIKLYGSMELAPLVGLADCIVDLVDTGNTLRANDMEPRELIMNISSRLVVNKAAMKMKNKEIVELLTLFEQTLAISIRGVGRKPLGVPPYSKVKNNIPLRTIWRNALAGFRLTGYRINKQLIYPITKI